MGNRGVFLKFAILALFLSYVVGQINLDTHEWSKGTRNDTELLAELQDEMREVVNTLTRVYMDDTISNLDIFPNVNSQCLDDLKVVITEIVSLNMDAIRFIDALAKLESGILNGNLQFTGDYSECITTEVKTKHTTSIIRGKYFTVLFEIHMHIHVFGHSYHVKWIPVGVCMPDSCDKSDTYSLLKFPFSRGLKVKQPKIVVRDVTTPPLSSDAIAVLAVIIFFVAVVFIGTCLGFFRNDDSAKTIESFQKGSDGTGNDTMPILDENTPLLILDENTPLLNKRKSNNSFERILTAFSLRENTKSLMNTSTLNSPIACLNGMRVISMFLLILGFSSKAGWLLLSNPGYVLILKNGFITLQMIDDNGGLIFDTFFFMSGLLVSFLALKDMRTKGNLNWLYYFGHRFWRLTPCYALLIFASSKLWSYFISGPFKFRFEPGGIFHSSLKSCNDYWWSNILYINNLFPNYGSSDGCMPWTWYLANEMQFYVLLAPVVIILLPKLRVVGIALSITLILGCVCLRGGLAAYYEMDQFAKAHAHTDSPWVNGRFQQYPFTRLSTYVVGMLTGYILHHNNCKITLSRLTCVIGWVISAGSSMAVIFGLYYYRHHPGTTASRFESCLYFAVSQTVWSVCLSWLVIACVSGYGGVVNSILSWRIWSPLDRLTYAAYLLHPMVTLVFLGNQTSTIMYTDTLFIYMGLGNIIITYVLSYIFSMLVEAPIMRIEQIFFKSRSR